MDNPAPPRSLTSLSQMSGYDQEVSSDEEQGAPKATKLIKVKASARPPPRPSGAYDEEVAFVASAVASSRSGGGYGADPDVLDDGVDGAPSPSPSPFRLVPAPALLLRSFRRNAKHSKSFHCIHPLFLRVPLKRKVPLSCGPFFI